MDIPQAIEIKEELETIDRLLKQLEEAAKNAKIAIIDLEELAQYAEPGDMDKLAQMQRQVEELVRHMAEQQGLQRTASVATNSPPKPTASSKANCWSTFFHNFRPPVVAGIKVLSLAKAPSSCSKPNRMNSATAWPTWTSRNRSSTP